MLRLSRCSRSDKPKLPLGGKQAFLGEIGHAGMDVSVSEAGCSERGVRRGSGC